MFKFLLVGLLAISAQAQEIGGANLGCFHGLNDAVTAAALPQCESPDLLNVESNLDATAILKRKGFSRSADLTVSTSPVSGSHSFIDSGGNRQDIVCQDRYCSKSTNGNAYATFLSTAGGSGSLPTRWSFVDVGGVLYGANNLRDPIMRYDGTTRSNPTGMPLGSILELTQDRLTVGDISGLPNRVHRSSAGAYEQFTVGVNPEDSFYDELGAAGDRIRGIKCIGGNCFYFKTASITLCEESDQYSTQCSVISPAIGTTDPASIVAAGSSLYFRAQDKSYYEISPQGLRQISKKIPNLVKSQSGGLGGGENTNTQTTKSDWEAGIQSPLLSWNTTTTNGSIFPSSVTLVDTSSADFSGGTLTNISTNVTGAIAIVQSGTATFRNAGAEANDATNYPTNTNWTRRSSSGLNMYGSYAWEGTTLDGCPTNVGFYVLNSANEVLVSSVVALVNSGDETFSIYTGTLAANAVKLRVTWLGTHENISVPYIRSSGIAVRMTDTTGSTSGGSPRCLPAWDVDEGTYTLSGNIVSRALDTAFSTPTYGTFGLTISSDTFTSMSFGVQTASSAYGAWGSIITVSTSTRITADQKEFIRYTSTFTVLTATSTPFISDVSIVAATTGQFTTQCIQPNSSISSWGTLSCAETRTGAGSLVYYTTSAATCGALPTTDPSTWQTSLSNNATVTIATNTAVKIGFRSLLGSATDQAQVDACVIAWNEGTPTQPAWAAYDSIKNAVYFTATVNGAASTNRLLKYDRNLEQWYPWDIPAQAPRFINNALYFGGASSGTWNLFGLVDSDVGAPVNAYWKSRDFGSDSPFKEKNFQTLSILSKNSVTGSMTGTWTLSNAKTGDYTISLSTGSGIAYARNNYNLPLSSPQQFLNVRVGNNSATPFEVLGIGVTWAVQPWKVSGP